MRQMTREIMRDAFFIVILSTLLGIAANILFPGYEFIGSSRSKEGMIVPVSAREAHIKHAASSALFVDARGAAEYSSQRIPGAINIPSSPASLSLRKIRESFDALKGDRELLIYCGDPACGASDELAGRLLKMGYDRHIYVLKEAFPSWREAGYPTEGEEGR